jgi:hypothetical protein
VSSSPLKNFALPALAALLLLGYLLWSRTQAVPTAAPASAPAEKTTSAPDRPTAQGADGSRAQRDAKATSPTSDTATRRDRARSDAMRRQIRDRRAAASAASRSGKAGSAGDADDTPPPGTLDKDYIRDRIREDLLPIAQECYESALEDDPKLAGNLVMKFSIVGDESVGGVVDDAKVDETSEIKHPGLVECMTESMLSLGFAPPENGGTVEVTYPFVFDTQPTAPAGTPSE